ncbi:MAG: S8 family peptidase [Candidatus Hydrothermales bacterium]
MLQLIIILALSQGKVIKNEIILWLKDDLRELIHFEKGKNTLSIPELDFLFEKYDVYEIDRLTKGKISDEAKKFDLDLIFLLRVKDENKAEMLKEQLSLLPYVRYVFNNEAYPLMFIPNDPYFPQMWNLTKMKVPQAWDITQGSPSVVVGAIDTGLWWEHVDLRGNLWVNPGEDINSNGLFDYPFDLNGIDDDGNGYVDDIIGFNFSYGIWNPSPEPSFGSDHGTHVTGTMAAVTNNGIGISGIGFNIRAAGLNCQLVWQDTSYINFYATVEAHYYGANMGFSVLNNSWGGYFWESGRIRMMQAAIDYARSRGAVVLAAAGNENVNLNSFPMYPATLKGVIAVAASMPNDVRATFSNYGDSVDVTAPGVSIWSTVLNNDYDSWDGTSMASPNAAGVCALIKSYFPSISPIEVERYLEGGADKIDSLNPGYAGLLGSGRVNAHMSLIYPFYSGLKVIDFKMIEVQGDGDNFFEGGEIVGIFPFVKNVGPQKADSFKITLKGSTNFTVIDSTVFYRNTLNVGNTILVKSDTFKILLNNVNDKDTLRFKIDGYPTSLYRDSKLKFFIGVPDVLVYYTDSLNNFYYYYEIALDYLNVKYDIWKHHLRGVPTFTPSMPQLVIWATGNMTSCLQESEINSFMNYLTLGGKLALTSQFAAENLDSPLDTFFFRNYLGIDRFNVPFGGGQDKARGVTGDPLAHGWFFFLSSSASARNTISPDEILNDTLGGTICIRYGPTGALKGAAVRTLNTVFFAFPLESVPYEGAATLTKLYQVIHGLFRYFNVSVEEKEPLVRFKEKEKISIILKNQNNLRAELFTLSGRRMKKPENLIKGLYFIKEKDRTIKIVNLN